METSSLHALAPRPTEGPRPQKAAKSILVVDHEESASSALSQYLVLTYQDYEIKAVSSAIEALEIATSQHLDLIIVDQDLEDMDGLSLVRSICAASPQTRAILTASELTHELRCNITEAGCSGYIQKPLNFEMLIQHMEAALSPSYNVELTDLDLADIIHLYAMKRQKAVLNIESASGSGVLVVDDGLLIHAEFESDGGIAALKKILRLLECNVKTGDSSIHYVQTIAIEAEMLREVARVPALADQLHAYQSFAKKEERDHSIDWLEQPLLESNSSSGVREALLKFELKTEKEDLTLAPEPQEAKHQPLVTPRDLSMKDERKLRKLVSSGINHFRNHQFAEARHCWRLALEINPKCPQALKNLEILDRVVKSQKKGA